VFEVIIVFIVAPFLCRTLSQYIIPKESLIVSIVQRGNMWSAKRMCPT